MASTTPPPSRSSLVGDQYQGDNNNPQVITEDGYEWKKYGQKFIKNIMKNRSYYKCRRSDCRARKKVEWPPSDPNDLRVVYEGGHNHPSPRHQSAPEQESSSPAANRYDLVTQMFGTPANPS